MNIDSISVIRALLLKLALTRQTDEDIRSELESVYKHYEKCKHMLPRDVRKPLERVYKAYHIWCRVKPEQAKPMSEYAMASIGAFVEIQSLFLFAISNKGYMSLPYRLIDRDKSIIKLDKSIVEFNRDLVAMKLSTTDPSQVDTRLGKPNAARLKHLTSELDSKIASGVITKEMLELKQMLIDNPRLFSYNIKHLCTSLFPLEVVTKETNLELFNLTDELKYSILYELNDGTSIPRKIQVVKSPFEPYYVGNVFY